MFWHGHKGCKYFVVPKTRTDWWLNKLNGNIANDTKAIKALKKEGGKLSQRERSLNTPVGFLWLTKVNIHKRIKHRQVRYDENSSIRHNSRSSKGNITNTK